MFSFSGGGGLEPEINIFSVLTHSTPFYELVTILDIFLFQQLFFNKNMSAVLLNSCWFLLKRYLAIIEVMLFLTSIGHVKSSFYYPTLLLNEYLATIATLKQLQSFQDIWAVRWISEFYRLE